MLTKKQVSQILLDIDAVSGFLTPAFKYPSGLLTLSSHAKERNAIIDTMVEQIQGARDRIDVVVSANTSSIFLASLLAQRLNLPMAYVRPSPKTHGKRKEIEGVFKAGQRALLVSDIIAEERDIPKSVGTIRQNGGFVVHCLAAFESHMSREEDFLKTQNIPHAALTDLATLSEMASNRRQPSLEKKPTLEWVKNLEKCKEITSTNNKQLLDDIGRKVAQILLKVGAVSINTKQPFKYTSGILSPIYTDNRLLISYPEQWKYIIDSFITIIICIIGSEIFDVLAGTATSGIPHASLVADKLNLPMVYVDFENYDKDQHSCIAGNVQKGDRVVMVEDHITTGKSVLSSARVLREFGANVDRCLAIFTYGTEKSKSTFKEAGVRLIPLCDLSTLMEVAITMKYIKPEDQKAVVDWLEDPEHWASNRRKTLNKTAWT